MAWNLLFPPDHQATRRPLLPMSGDSSVSFRTRAHFSLTLGYFLFMVITRKTFKQPVGKHRKVWKNAAKRNTDRPLSLLPLKKNPIILRAVHTLCSDQNNAKYHGHYVYASSHGQCTHSIWTKTSILIKSLNLVLSSIFRFSFVSFLCLQTTLAPQHCSQ